MLYGIKVVIEVAIQSCANLNACNEKEEADAADGSFVRVSEREDFIVILRDPYR